MSGPPPAPTRRRRNAPVKGPEKPAPGVGWQHGAVPKPPAGLLPRSVRTWTTWMAAWFAAHWTPADLPGIELVIEKYDAVARGGANANDLTVLVRMMDGYGITPNGQQQRRWVPPKVEAPKAETPAPAGKLYGHLRAVGE